MLWAVNGSTTFESDPGWRTFLSIVLLALIVLWLTIIPSVGDQRKSRFRINESRGPG